MTDVFTYGSLMCNDIMHHVAGCQVEGVPAVLKDFKRSKIRGEEYPGIVVHPKAEVAGILYRGLPPQAIERLDSFEGAQYSRQDVQLLTETGSCLAMTYVIKSEYSHLLIDEAWSYDHFLAVGKARFLEAYVGFQKI